MAQSESQLQMICVCWFNEIYPDYIIAASLNGIKLSGKQKYGVVDKQRKEGLLPGIPDLLVLLPKGKSLHIELKTTTGKQSKQQLAIQAKMGKLNHKYYICRTFQEFKQIIKDNL